jgi:hypothetical protein
MIKEASSEGTITVAVPKKFGKRIEIILLPASEEKTSHYGSSFVCEKLNTEERFLAATYLAAIEDDEEEDAVWRKYL